MLVDKFYFFLFNFLKSDNSLTMYFEIVLLILIKDFMIILTFKIIILRFCVYALATKLINYLLVFLDLLMLFLTFIKVLLTLTLSFFIEFSHFQLHRKKINC